ncbi:vang-like protein 1 [Mixophyes fleayi]|uniref:vang-like protein 1 n=1 Tax=Mixophyes fleayi TaxID=3061075 RepID=UPI003F4E1AAA
MDAQSVYSEQSFHSRQGSERERNYDVHKTVTIQSQPLLAAEDSGRGEEEEEEEHEREDNWGETTTALTSERSASLEDLTPKQVSQGPQTSRLCARTMLGFYIFCVLAVLTLLTPPVFIILPQVLWRTELDPCGVICEGLYISVAFKVLFMVLGSWAVFFRTPRYVLPRLVEFRALLLLLLGLFLASYWLFYVVRVLGSRERNLLSVVQYATSLVDAFIFIHYLAVVLLEIRQLKPFYHLKVVRSSDGVVRFYTMGTVSIQRAALFVLQNYVKDFPTETPEPRARTPGIPETHPDGRGQCVDGLENNPGNRSQARTSSNYYKERYYEEIEHKRKIRKRRARLVVAVHRAFSQIHRLDDDLKSPQALNLRDAAQSLVPLIAQSLQRYLRSTRQTHLYTMEGIIQHLTQCLTHNMSPQAFLKQYLQPGPPAQYFEAQSYLWTLVSEVSVTRTLHSNLTFCLRSSDTQLVVSVSGIPSLTLRESFIPPNSHRFVLRSSSGAGHGNHISGLMSPLQIPTDLTCELSSLHLSDVLTPRSPA